MKIEKKRNRTIFFSLWILCIIGSLAVLPYLQCLGAMSPSTPLRNILLMTVLQSALFFGLICWLSSKILPKTDLAPFTFKKPLQTIVYPAVISGVLLSFAIFFADKTLFHSPLSSTAAPPFWVATLASLYGGVNEEVLLRLFLFTLLYFLLNKCCKINKENKTISLWTVNIIVALLFGLGHLPAAFKLPSPSAVDIVRILFLNGLGGILFGWLYWSRGLWTAIGAHFVTDLMIHGFLA